LKEQRDRAVTDDLGGERFCVVVQKSGDTGKHLHEDNRNVPGSFPAAVLITVADVLGWLVSGMTHESILIDFSKLAGEDICACLWK